MKLPPKVRKTVHRSNWKSDTERGTRQERGYDKAWQKVRRQFLANNPLCVHCLRQGRRRMATQVDHIIPFVGISDPLRLAEGNLQSLCEPCHRRKTSASSRQGNLV